MILDNKYSQQTVYAPDASIIIERHFNAHIDSESKA